ncbi:MAG: cytochrome c [Pseudomonadota bacterium]
MKIQNLCAGLALIPLLLVGAACSKKAPEAPPKAEPVVSNLRPVASVLDLMLGVIDPAADSMWESVATISGPKGIEERQPRTEKEWTAVRANALMVIEGANMLMVEGRKVALPGQHLEDPGSATDFTPAQAQAAIDADRPAFVAFAHALQDAAGSALAAIEKRDSSALLEAGGDLDEACENCHKRFWYPGSPVPPGA